ncbi:alpha/beta fold hydrolase [Oleiphilus messinensis]|nr:alpha/beta hydrolase [Oleiphilus messinensis]
MNSAPRSQTGVIAKHYLSHPKTASSQDELENWRPKTSFFSMVDLLTRALPLVQNRDAFVDGHRIRYLDIGSSNHQPVVLLHGFSASKENWLSMVFSLLKRRYRLLIPDLPGFGMSSFRAAQRYSYEIQANRLADWYEKLHLGPAHWVGSSMGGAIAAGIASARPEGVKTLTLMNAAGVSTHSRSPMEDGLVTGDNVLIPDSYRDVEKLFRFTTHRSQGLWARTFPAVLAKDMLHRRPVHRKIFQDMLTPAIPTEEVLMKIKTPTFILWGNRDRIIDVSCVALFEQLIPHAQSKILKGIGHLPMIESPELTARCLHKFWMTPTA